MYLRNRSKGTSIMKLVTQKVQNVLVLKIQNWDFPGGTMVKNPPANAGATGSSPGPGRSHMPRSN